MDHRLTQPSCLCGHASHCDVKKNIAAFCAAHDTVRRLRLYMKVVETSGLSALERFDTIMTTQSAIEDLEREAQSILDRCRTTLQQHLAPYASSPFTPSILTPLVEVDAWYVAQFVFDTTLATYIL